MVHRVVCFVWRSASSGGLRDDTAAGMVERCQSDIHSKMFAPCFLRASCDVGMAFSLAEDRGLSRSRFNRHSPGFACSVLRIADAGIIFLFSQRPRSVSLWNEVPLTLIAGPWPGAFFLSDSKAGCERHRFAS